MRGPACWKAQNRFKDISPVHEYVSKKKETNTVVYYYLHSTIKLPCLIESRSKIKLPLCRNPVLVLQEEGTYKLSQKVVAQKNDSSKFNLWEDAHHSVQICTIKGFEICI
jgi:hypothetical protein